MKIFFVFLFIGYVVRCDDANYYVIEMPEEDATRVTKKPLRVYWNVPTMQCKSKKIPFENLFEKYGILQNKNDSFRGEKISILYDPGLFPAILKNDSSGTLKFRNGGVPQGGNIEEHLESFKQELDRSIPNPDFSGLGIIDFESWRPIFRQNFGVLVPYKDTSYEIERKLHWWWPDQWIKSEARRRFEISAREFMQTTLSVAKQMRPNANWGYYAFPYCFNMAKNGLHESCADGVPAENDRLYWLWSESSALFPSIYSSRSLSTSQLAALVRGRMAEAKRVRRKDSPILPYFWFRHREGGYMSEVDLKSVLHTLYTSEATGFIIWGSSNDVNTKEKCNNLQNYLDKILGPNIAKYTKGNTIFRDDVYEADNEIKENTTTTEKYDHDHDQADLDPEFHWEPPENYTNNIKENVEEEIKKKNSTLDNKFSSDGTQNDSVLITLLLSSIKKENNTSNLVEDQSQNHLGTETSHSVSDLPSKNDKKGYPITDHGIEGFIYTTKGPYLFDTKSSITTLSTNDYTKPNTSTEASSSILTDQASKFNTQSTTFKTESPNFASSTDDPNGIYNSNEVIKTESSKLFDETLETETTESKTDSESTQSISTENIQTILIEDVTENGINLLNFFNLDTLFKGFHNTETTETSTEQTTDISGSEFSNSTVTKNLSEDDKSTNQTDLTDYTDSTTEIYSISDEESSLENTSREPNQVVVI